MTRDEALERIHDPNGAPLAEDEQRAFEAWLERDAELRAIHDEQRALFAAMDAWTDGVEPSENFDQRLWARIEAEAARPSWTQTLTSWLSWPRAAWAGCAVALLAAVAVWVGPRQQPVETQKVAKVEAVAVSGEDAEFLQDLDRALDDMEMLKEFDALAPDTAPEGRI
jgi:anti-sigma-K factor RskA